MEVSNLSGAVRLIYWRDYNGQRMLYKTMQPGEKAGFSTLLTHPWVVTDTGG